MFPSGFMSAHLPDERFAEIYATNRQGWHKPNMVSTTDANDPAVETHDRMPLVSQSVDLVQPFPAKPMRMWPISLQNCMAHQSFVRLRVLVPTNGSPSLRSPQASG